MYYRFLQQQTALLFSVDCPGVCLSLLDSPGVYIFLGGSRERINHEEMKPFASSSSRLDVQMDGPAAAEQQRVLDYTTYEIYIQDLRLTDSIQLLPPTSIIHLMLLPFL